jgi:hypothetical protein
MGEPSEFRAQLSDVFEELNDLLGYSHDQIRDVFGDTEPETITVGNLGCRVYEADGELNHWKAEICRLDGVLREYSWEVVGRPLASTSDDDYLPVFAGRAIILGDNLRRGKLGWHLDNLSTLRDDDSIGGRVGIGFRVFGRARQFTMSLDAAYGPSSNPEDGGHSGIYRYRQVRGEGGSFSHVGEGEFVRRNNDDELVLGVDGLIERGRAAITWRRGVGARSHAIVCGGTVADDDDNRDCARVVQCWSTANAETTFELIEQIDGTPSAPDWDEVACPEGPTSVDEVPAESDEDVPADDAETNAPAADEPATDPLEAE